jgi:hypothetical protein
MILRRCEWVFSIAGIGIDEFAVFFGLRTSSSNIDPVVAYPFKERGSRTDATRRSLYGIP